MRVTKSFAPYNARRYGRPWIAFVTNWPIGKPPTLEFGGNVGPHLCEIEAMPGQIVRWGQKDHRGNGTVSEWGIVMRDGSLQGTTAAAAREHWIAGCPPIDAQAPEEGVVVPFKQRGEG